MTVLILEPLEAEVVQWLAERHDACFAPELVGDTRGLQAALRESRALIAPPEVRVDAELLRGAPTLCAIGRASGGAENIDIEACRKAGVEVVRSQSSTASAEAEFAIGALLSLLRRVPVEGSDGLKVGRELGCSTIGLLGMTPTAQVLAQLLHAFGARVVGYDPGMHPSDATWARWGIEAVSLSDLVEHSDGLVLLLPYFERFRGLVGERQLENTRAGQVLVGLSHSSIFEEAALGRALRSGKLRAAWFDSLEPGWLEAGRPLHGVSTLQVTPRLAGTTRESRVRAAWAVARGLDELLGAPPKGKKKAAGKAALDFY
jgi:D-3-phosphoglycerate dehydrogenase / 2-oxoglutarate reductase